MKNLAILILSLILISCNKKYQSKELSYINSVKNHRTKNQEFMQKDMNSPFHKKGDIPFEELKYFDIDTAYKMKAQLTLLPFPEPYTMKMSDGTTQPYVKIAWAGFSLHGVPQKVLLLKMEKFMEENWLFLPFYDETSANSTYGGGRFLDVDYTGNTIVEIDFNFAYNPYCAYNPDYSCPIPPIENQITVKVEAGEKKYKETH